jgi:uncharacterized protein YwgA
MTDYKVISPFRDKYTKKVYRKGDLYSHKQSERIDDLTKRGFIQEVTAEDNGQQENQQSNQEKQQETNQEKQEQQEEKQEQQEANKDQQETTSEQQKPAATAKDYPKHTGGGWYELSNGEKVQGKEEADKAEAAL